MNRRDLLRRAFAVSAAGLLLPVIEPTRKVWALDRTMVPRGRGEMVSWSYSDESGVLDSGWFDASMPSFNKQFYVPEEQSLDSIVEFWTTTFRLPLSPPGCQGSGQSQPA